MDTRFTRTGTVKAFHASEISHSRIALGFEKLDRDVFDPEQAYDRVAELGVKWVRIQSGWAKTEKSPGHYDWAWLDRIVDNLRRRGLQPWVCLCYGNPLYTPAAAKVFGAVGCPPIATETEQLAWQRYVAALTQHLQGRVEWFEVWNEPDGIWCWKHGVNATEYGHFVIRTAAAVRAGNPAAKVIGGALCHRGLAWLNAVLASGAATCLDAVSYHNYTPDETSGFDRVDAIRALIRQYNPALQLIQGETGTQSRSDGAGALRQGAWTEERQAKYLARHMLADLLDDVSVASYFSCVDMIEALNGVVGDQASYLDFGYFGVLSAAFDADGKATGTYTPKPSYRTLQTIASLFREDFSVTDLPVLLNYEHSPRIMRQPDPATCLVTGGFLRPDGSAALAFWKPVELLTTTYESTLSLEAAGLPEPVQLVDPLDGTVYAIPPELCERDAHGLVRLKELPLRDYPLLLTFGPFAAVNPA